MSFNVLSNSSSSCFASFAMCSSGVKFELQRADEDSVPCSLRPRRSLILWSAFYNAVLIGSYRFTGPVWRRLHTCWCLTLRARGGSAACLDINRTCLFLRLDGGSAGIVIALLIRWLRLRKYGC